MVQPHGAPCVPTLAIAITRTRFDLGSAKYERIGPPATVKVRSLPTARIHWRVSGSNPLPLLLSDHPSGVYLLREWRVHATHIGLTRYTLHHSPWRDAIRTIRPLRVMAYSSRRNENLPRHRPILSSPSIPPAADSTQHSTQANDTDSRTHITSTEHSHGTRFNTSLPPSTGPLLGLLHR